MPQFEISVDDVAEEIFYEIENVADGGSHDCIFIADSEEEAARILSERLMPYFQKKFFRR
jgi:hypothetical protein